MDVKGKLSSMIISVIISSSSLFHCFSARTTKNGNNINSDSLQYIVATEIALIIM